MCVWVEGTGARRSCRPTLVETRWRSCDRRNGAVGSGVVSAGVGGWGRGTARGGAWEQVSGPGVDCYTKKKNSSESFRRNSVVLTDVVVLEPFNSFRLFCCRLRFFVGPFDAAALLQRAQ